MQDNRTTGSEAKAAPAADANGTSEQQTQTASADEARRQATQRAEEMVDRLGEQIGHYVSVIGHNVLKWAARAREEAEDIWAEAQAIRERQHNQKS
jgi:sorbitol-specific phosphotransferase system component IIBC